MIDRLLPTVAARWLIGLVIIAALCAWSFFHGYIAGRDKLDEYIGKQAEAATAIGKKQSMVTVRVLTKYVERAAATATTQAEIAKEVQTYGDKNPDGACLDPEWRRLHDRSAVGPVPGPAPGTDGAGGAPSAAAAIQTVSANYATCQRTAERLDALQEWVREQAKVTAQ